MEFNNRRERKRFETEWAKLRQEYHNAGMSEDAIQRTLQVSLLK